MVRLVSYFLYKPIATYTIPDYAGNRTSLSNITTVVVRNAPATCWKTMYHLLDLYATMPETKTVSQRISVSPEASEKNVKKQLIETKLPSNREDDDECINTPVPPVDVVAPERSRLVVFGVAKIQKTRLLATLSGLKVIKISLQLKCWISKMYILVGS